MMKRLDITIPDSLGVIDAKNIPGIDQECIQVVDALNSLPQVETFESCCGHGTSPFRVWFGCTSWLSLAILARSTDRNYSTGMFRIQLQNSDSSPGYVFMLESVRPLTPEEMAEETASLTRSIR